MADAVVPSFSFKNVNEEHRKAKNRDAQRQHRATLKSKLAKLDGIKRVFGVASASTSPSLQTIDLPSLYDVQRNLTPGNVRYQHEAQVVGLQPIQQDYYGDIDAESNQAGDCQRPETSCDYRNGMRNNNDSPQYFHDFAGYFRETSLPIESASPAADPGLCRNSQTITQPQIYQSNENINQHLPANPSPLHRAISAANVICVRILDEHGADVNTTDQDGLTPLHRCIVAGHSEDYQDIARLLIENGASLAARDRLGCTPLQVAAGNGNVNMVAMLAELGADVNAS